METSFNYLIVYTILLESFTPVTKGIVRSTCWDGLVGVDYIGTQTITQSGYTCQAWMSDSPHVHSTDDLALFPYDQETGPSNYCRDPGGWSATGPWCYTMNPSVLWQTCNIPICSNLPCDSSGTSRGQTDPSSTIANLDTNIGTVYLLKDTNTYGITCCGTVSEWRIYAQNSGTIRLQVWRHNASNGKYRLMGENVYTLSGGETNTSLPMTVSQIDKISVENGDLIGWFTNSSAMLPYSTGSTNQNAILTSGVVAIGDEVDFGPATVEDSRDYAIGITIARGLVPYFTNAGNSLSITTAETVGTTVSILTVTDDDVDDVSSLNVSVDANTYFDVSELSGNDSTQRTAGIVVKAGLVTGSYNVTFRVTDHCELSGSHILTINVSTSPLDIATLPGITSVSETITVETLLHNITVTPAGSYTCVFDSYSPTRTEGNPFDIKSSAFTDYGVYLKSSANIQYNVTTSYTLIVNCSSATETISETLMVNLDPNNPPTFQNFQSTISVNASATPAFTVIYTATVTDADNDTVTLTLITDPATSAFSIGNDGNIQTEEDLIYHQQATYTLIISASDGYTTVNSSSITMTITDINLKPVLTNVPSGIQSILENQASGTEVFQVSYTDGNGDTATFSVTFSPTTCNTMFSLDPNTGSMTTLASFDYETEAATICNATITAFDGRNESDASIVTIEVTNVDETPIIQQSAYITSTAEVVSGTELPDLGIVVTEPEGQSVALGLNCHSDSGYLSINDSGIITMATAFDVDALVASDTYTISCDLLASDTAGNTATSTVNVTVTDANDNSPTFSQAVYSVSLYEGHSGFGTLVTASATDGDRTSPNKDITYSLSATTHFNIDSSGNIYNTANLTGEAAGTSFTLTITATDGGTSPLSDTATFTATIFSSTTAGTAATAASAASSGSSSSSNGSFFSDTGNIVFLVISVFLLGFLSVLTGVLVWKQCFPGKPLKGRRFGKQDYVVNQTRPSKSPAKDGPIISEPKETYRPASGESGISLATNHSSESNSNTDWIKRIENLRDSPRTPRHINVRSLTNKTSVF